jgi:beta-glucosidase
MTCDEKDMEAARRLDELWNRWYLDPFLLGEYPPLAKKFLNPQKGDMDLIHQTPDFLDVNYYTRQVVASDPANPLTAARLIPKSSFVTETGWEVYPRGMLEILTRVKMDMGISCSTSLKMAPPLTTRLEGTGKFRMKITSTFSRIT